MSSQTTVSLVTWSLGYAMSAIAVFLKLYTRIKYVNGLEVDDFFAILTFLIFTAGMGVIYTMLVLGLQEGGEGGLRWLFLPPNNLTLLFQCFFISVQLYTLGILFSKLALIYLYKKIVKSSQIMPQLNLFLNALVCICVIFTTVGIILNFFWCRPLYSFWVSMPLPQDPKYCSRTLIELSVYMYSSYNMLTDICIIIVPFFFLSRAAIRSRGQRLALFVLFGMGIFVIISTAIKIIAIAQRFQPPSLVFWSFIEACVAIVVVCLPSLPPLIWKNTNLRDISAADLSAARWTTIDDVEMCDSPSPAPTPTPDTAVLEESPLEPLPSVYLSKLFSSGELEMFFMAQNLERNKKDSFAPSISSSQRTKVSSLDTV